MSASPTTEAGRALLEAIASDTLMGDPRGYVFAIEAEARAAVLREVAERFEREVAPLIVGTKYEVLAGQAVLRACLAILTEAKNHGSAVSHEAPAGQANSGGASMTTGASE